MKCSEFEVGVWSDEKTKQNQKTPLVCSLRCMPSSAIRWACAVSHSSASLCAHLRSLLLLIYSRFRKTSFENGFTFPKLNRSISCSHLADPEAGHQRSSMIAVQGPILLHGTLLDGYTWTCSCPLSPFQCRDRVQSVGYASRCFQASRR